MLDKKMLVSILTLGILATIAGAGTWAYYSSSVTSAGNTITTGKILLSLENGDYSTGDTGDLDNVSFTVTDAMPGDGGLVKMLKVQNDGRLPGKLTVTAANVRDSKGLGKYLTIKVGKQVIYDHGVPVEGVITNSLAGRHYVIPDVTYMFEDNGNPQDEVQDATFMCEIVFTLKSIPG